MQLLLSDACQQHPKPTLALVGATIQPGLAETAASMVCPIRLATDNVLSVASSSKTTGTEQVVPLQLGVYSMGSAFTAGSL